jgi:hypothetical protein
MRLSKADADLQELNDTKEIGKYCKISPNITNGNLIKFAIRHGLCAVYSRTLRGYKVLSYSKFSM